MLCSPLKSNLSSTVNHSELWRGILTSTSVVKLNRLIYLFNNYPDNIAYFNILRIFIDDSIKEVHVHCLGHT